MDISHLHLVVWNFMLGEKRRRHLVPVYHEVPLLGHKSFDPLLVLHHGSPGILQDMGRPREYTSNKAR